jgi:uncharacterized protein (TIGR02117 family)
MILLKSIIKRIIRSIIRFLIGFILALLIYFIIATFLSLVPVNRNFKETPEGIAIYLLTNGVHTDIVLPVKNELKDWSPGISVYHTLGKDTTLNYAAFGWGDKDFYVNTPEWSDLKFKTAFNALFFLGDGAMHVTFFKNLNSDNHCKKIFVNKEQYLKLSQNIEKNFCTDTLGNFILIPNPGFGNNDCFYEAKKAYNLSRTCNTWTNSVLKRSGLRACVWTPFRQGIFYQYRKF